MSPIPLLQEADELLSQAESVATVLAEKSEELGLDVQPETLLRAAITGARFAADAYLAMSAGPKRSTTAARLVGEAKARCKNKLDILRRRLTRSISRLNQLMDEKVLGFWGEGRPPFPQVFQAATNH